MNLSKLINHIGDENVGIQILDRCVTDIRTKEDECQITFLTDQSKVEQFSRHKKREFYGMILWLPLERMPESFNDNDKRPHE